MNETSRRFTSRAARSTLATAVVLGLATALAVPAGAAPRTTPAPGPEETVTIAVDADRLARLCERLPQLRDRAENLVELIEAGPEVTGSAAWLQARADRAEGLGRDDQAQILRTRAQIRLDRVASITVVIARVDEVAAEHCTDAGS